MVSLRPAHLRVLLALCVLAGVVVLVLDVPHATSDFSHAFARITAGRLVWLGAAVGVEFCSIGAFAVVQRRLLQNGPHRVGFGSLLRLAVATLGLQAILPIGALPSAGWLVTQYRRVGASTAYALYMVAASFFAALVTLFGLFLLGALVGGLGSTLSLTAGLVGLLAGTSAAVAVVHRFGARPHLARSVLGPWSRRFDGAMQTLAAAARCRTGARNGAGVLVASAGTWVFDCACLVCGFELMGLPVPWRGILFAYALAQIAGGVVPLPGGIGAVEGGAIGGLVLVGVGAGDALAATLAYRVISYWGEGLVGGLMALSLARRPIPEARGRRRVGELDPRLELHPAGSALDSGA